ncbi:hypothetical protein CRENBAI_025446 [Crenichthys baileyi]|uniref:Uncharacterized protein n=1 Tax=Crenichthys baileyi TaxID=28760 RepID=A0AAV9QVI0_9TELE
MGSQYWNAAQGRRPDYRRYTVVEGETPLPLGSTCHRKRLRSSGEEEDEEARKSCARRPNPEGSLSASELSRYGKPEEKKQQRLCQCCHIMASQLNRQAAALADSASMKGPNRFSGIDMFSVQQVPANGPGEGDPFYLLAYGILFFLFSHV